MPSLPQELTVPPMQRGAEPVQAATGPTIPRRHAGPPPSPSTPPLAANSTSSDADQSSQPSVRTPPGAQPSDAAPAVNPARTPPYITSAPFPEPPSASPHGQSASTQSPAPHPSTGPVPSGELAPARRQVTNISPVLFGAGLGVLLVVLGLPTLVLVWRSALTSPLSPSGLVGGLLVLVGLVVLSVGGFSLASGAGKVEQDAAAGRWAAVVLRPSILLVLLGTVLLICAALAVS